MKRILFPILFLSFFCFCPWVEPCLAAAGDGESHPKYEISAPAAGNPDAGDSVRTMAAQNEEPIDRPGRKTLPLGMRMVLLFLSVVVLISLFYIVLIRTLARHDRDGDSGNGICGYPSDKSNRNHRNNGYKAGVGYENGCCRFDRQATEREVELIRSVHRMMVDLQAYRDCDLTLETLARRLGVSRETLSRAVNRTTDKNFSRFLNEYRVKEAIRRLSATCNREVNFDYLSEQVGFNNRTSFHRAFKQITGLPPATFKNRR